MTKHSKRFNNIKPLIENKNYSYHDGIFLLKKIANAKFVESVEIHFCLKLNTRNINELIHATCVFPNAFNTKLKLAVLTDIENKSQFYNAGATIVGFEDLLNNISQKKIFFDILLTTPNLVPKLIPFSKILGPKGLMPSIKIGTISSDLKKAMYDIQSGKVEYKNDRFGVIHLNFGIITMTERELEENFLTIYNSVIKNRPLGVKGNLLKSLHICSTMSPSIAIDFL